MEWRISDYYNYFKENNKNKFGEFHKCVFHIHTPASNDYNAVDESDIGLRDRINKLIPMLKNVNCDLSFTKTFSNLKEYYLYLLIAIKLIENDVELVLVSDHQTINGIKKLEEAINDLKTNCKFGKVYPEVLSGIEINCADRNHVVGIFPDYKTAKGFINEFDDEIMDVSNGTYLTSLEVLKRIKSVNGLGYIAHIENSDIAKNVNLKYKKKIFNDDSLVAIGVKSIDKIEDTKKRLKKYSQKIFPFILEDDSHSYDDLLKRVFWIKGNKCNYDMVEDALRDSTITVHLTEPVKNRTNILGLMAFSGEKGFLKSYDYPFMVSFSPNLNCIIGGRGTGKSTIINLIDIILKQSTLDISRLLQLFTMEEVSIVIMHNGSEYIICFTPEKGIVDIKDYLLKNHAIDKIRNLETINELECQRLILNHLQICKIVIQEKDVKYMMISRKENKIKFLKEIYSRSFSVNELVKKAEDKESLNSFIIDILFDNEMIFRTKQGKLRAGNNLQDELKKMDTKLLKRSQKVNSHLEVFNSSQKDIIRVIYNVEEFDPSWFMGSLNLLNNNLFKNFNIRNKDINNLLTELFWKYGCKKVITNILERKMDYFQYEKVEEYVLEYNSKYISEKSYMDIESNFNEFKNTLMLFIINNSDKILNGIDNFYKNFESLGLEFNLKEQNKPNNFKNIRYLSSGQKTVGMLTFVLGYSKLITEKTPLIIDQPEDNLDNKYIYETLVSVLKEQKDYRQVMVATHNSTIVINAKSEQVIIMNSNNINGWVEKTGYYIEKKY